MLGNYEVMKSSVNADSCLQAMLQITGFDSPPKPRHAMLTKLSDTKSGDTIDHGLVLWFPGTYVHLCMSIVESLVTKKKLLNALPPAGIDTTYIL